MISSHSMPVDCCQPETSFVDNAGLWETVCIGAVQQFSDFGRHNHR